MIDLDTIRTGLRDGEFFLEYLPIISLSDGRCIGAEALVRWRRPSGVVPPNDFIPQIENTPLSGLLTYWVIDTVAADLGDWLRYHRDAHVGINVPPEILGRGGLEYAAKNAGLHDVVPQIIIEVTERGVPDALAVTALNAMGQWGIPIALDDVTLVGGANLAILARCPFNIIKLDRSLISQIVPHTPDPEWLTGLATMLGTSPLVVIAEGVETEYQARMLRRAGVQAAQGYYFSKPVPVADFVAYHRTNQVELPDRSGTGWDRTSLKST
jgi:sensor c-di-GMP phosphodiesterase-like protein